MKSSKESEGRGSINRELSHLVSSSDGSTMESDAEDMASLIRSDSVQDVIPRYHLSRRQPIQARRRGLNKNKVDLSIIPSKESQVGEIAIPGVVIEEETVSSEDIVDRISAQDVRFNELKESNKLTSEWKQYGARRGL